MASWFKDIGWWDQNVAYASFDKYRDDPTKQNLDIAIQDALPIIRVVFSTQSLSLSTACDTEDLISAAAETITRAMPKIVKKSKNQIGNDKQYMRYLFTCVLNAFYRELNVLKNRHSKVLTRLQEKEEANFEAKDTVAFAHSIELKHLLGSLAKIMHTKSLGLVRFPKHSSNFAVCDYMLKQLTNEKEISNAILVKLGCNDKTFYLEYCNMVLIQAFMALRKDIKDANVFSHSTMY